MLHQLILYIYIYTRRLLCLNRYSPRNNKAVYFPISQNLQRTRFWWFSVAELPIKFRCGTLKHSTPNAAAFESRLSALWCPMGLLVCFICCRCTAMRNMPQHRPAVPYVHLHCPGKMTHLHVHVLIDSPSDCGLFY